MAFFLILYLTIYLLMHCYAYLHAWQALRCSRKQLAGPAVFALVMVLCPLLVRAAEKHGLESTAKFLAYTGFSWMGLLFIFISLGVLVDLVRICTAVYRKIRGDHARASARTGRRRLYAEALLVLALYGYGLFESNHIRTEHLVISSPKITSEREELRLVQISDVHLGLIVRKSRLEKILARVREAKPDLLISTGDLVDGQLNNLSGLADMLASINAPRGKFAVTGNHEFYAGLPDALDFTRKAGFEILRNQAYHLPGMTLVGIDDPAGARFGAKPARTETPLLREGAQDSFTVLLKHRPVVKPESRGLFDLQLSGHTHRGQIFPFTLLTRLFFRHPTGLVELASGYLYTSRGSGTWGPPIRFLAPPEVTVIDLVRQG